MSQIYPILVAGVESENFSAAVGVLTDLCQHVKTDILPYCDNIMQALLTAFQNAQLLQANTADIVSLLGDIATAIGGETYQRYLLHVLQVLSTARETVMQEVEGDIGDDAIALQQAWIDAWSSLFQSFHFSPESLLPAVVDVMQTVIAIINQTSHAQIVSTAINLIG